MSSPQSAAIECFWARLDRPTSLLPPLGRLDLHPRITKATAPWQANRDLGSNPCSVACVCSAFPVCYLAVTNITVYPTASPVSQFTSLGSNCPLVRWGGGFSSWDSMPHFTVKSHRESFQVSFSHQWLRSQPHDAAKRAQWNLELQVAGCTFLPSLRCCNNIQIFKSKGRICSTTVTH